MPIPPCSSSAAREWRQRVFQKDAKLRIRERYWRDVEEMPESYHDPISAIYGRSNNSLDSNTEAVIIPDAVSWRMYLSLIQLMIQSALPLRWCLLETVAESMEHRNQSPTIAVKAPPNNAELGIESTLWTREPFTPHERMLIQTLAFRPRDLHNRIHAVCDASLRNVEDGDEWDTMDYDSMTVSERAQYAIMRSAHLLAQKCARFPLHIWVLRGDGNPDSSWPISCELSDQKSLIRCGSMQDILQWLFEKSALSRERHESFMLAARDCEDAYGRRIKQMIRSPVWQHTIDHAQFTTEEAIQQGVREGKLYEGRLHVTKDNPQEAFVSCDKGKYFIDGLKGHFDYAIHQDTVVILPLLEGEWGRPVGKRRLIHYNDFESDIHRNTTNHVNDALLVNPIPSARVISVAKPGRRIVVATLIDTPSVDDTAILVVPMDVRIPKIRIKTRSWPRWEGVRLKIMIDGWEIGSKYPHGHCVDVIGSVGDLETEIMALLLENEIHLEPFSLAARACLPPEGEEWVVTEEESASRRDLRWSRRVFSVDPPGCQDIDDTMHAHILPDGDIEVGVHIADVTHFVKQNSPLDIEARARGTTFYLVDRRFDMLPGLLSSNLCSLHGGVDRLALSVIWVFSSDLKHVKSCWYGRTVIRNCAAMTYAQADKILEGRDPDESGASQPPPLTAGAPVARELIGMLREDLTILTRLARLLRASREDVGGAVDFSNEQTGTELKFTLNGDGQPVKVTPKQDKEIHHTIAEMMILANNYVATKIFDTFPNTALLRVHRPVEEERFEDLKAALAVQGLKLDGTSNHSLADSLREAREALKDNPAVSSLLLSLATRAMTEALYICTGNSNGADHSHYGLGLEKYTHFTSPIRRYADVVVHNQLLATLQAEFSSCQTLLVKDTTLLPVEPPPSNVLSVLTGQRIISTIGFDQPYRNHVDEFQGKSLSSLPPIASGNQVFEPYSAYDVVTICERLNVHNRLAKQSSSECQNLFLSLYFRNSFEITSAVVTSVKTNGFFVYIPKFDFRAPVYVRDIDGNVQMDPTLFGLPPDSGKDPTVGFSKVRGIRCFSDGKCSLVGGDESLEVTLPGSPRPFTVHALDVVTVLVFCDDWDARARVPTPRVHLIARPQGPSPSGPLHETEISPIRVLSNSATTEASKGSSRSLHANRRTIADVVVDARQALAPFLPEVPIRVRTCFASASVSFEEVISGRRVFGSFKNPDTRSAAQESAQQSAAAETASLREQLLNASARRREYDTSQAIARMATTRQQRLASEKRNSRRAKAK